MRIHDLLSSKDLSRVARLQLLARQVVDGLCSGRHRSHQKGFSVEFKEHRPYVRGDDLRNIDWKVYGKSDRLYIRESEEETNLRCTLIVDRSGSMRYCGGRSSGTSKYEYAQGLAASLAYLMLRQHDAVGVITFDDAPREIVPCSSRPSHLRPLMNALAAGATSHETDLGGAIQRIIPKIGRRGLVVLLTDAMGDAMSIGRALARLRASNHEVLLFQILDPDETDFPFSGRIRFHDLENLTHVESVNAITIRDAYLRRFDQHQSALREVCRNHRVDWVPLTTDRSLVDALHEYLSLRGRLR